MELSFAEINILVTFCVVALGLCCFVLRFIHGKPDFLDSGRHKATAWAFGFWLCWWLSMAAAYTVAQEKGLADAAMLLFLLDVGDLALIGFAIAYLGGNSKLTMRRFAPLLLFAIALSIFYVLVGLAISTSSPTLLMMFAVAPSVALAIVANLVAAWAFLVRWGYTAFPLFILSGLYSIAQAPAYFILFVVRMHAEGAVQEYMIVHTDTVFYFLAFGKAVVAAMSLVLFLSTTLDKPDMTRESYWPTWQQAIPLRPVFTRLYVKAIGGAFALLFTLMIKPFRQWLMGVLN